MRVIRGGVAAVTPKVNFDKMAVYSEKVSSHPKAKRARGYETNKCHHRQLLRHHSSSVLFTIVELVCGNAVEPSNIHFIYNHIQTLFQPAMFVAWLV